MSSQAPEHTHTHGAYSALAYTHMRHITYMYVPSHAHGCSAITYTHIDTHTVHYRAYTNEDNVCAYMCCLFVGGVFDKYTVFLGGV